MELDEKKYDSLSFSIILIIVSVIAGNWVSMFGLDTPIFDDLYGQIFALENEISWRFPIRNPIGPIMKYYIMELLTINIYFARAIFVIFAAIPLSLAFFWFYRNILGINNIVAATAAAIPNILPGQDIIFHSLIQSYMVYYMIPTLLALIIGVKYLKGKKSIFTLMAALFLYLFACTSVEQAVFLFVPFSFIFLITARFSRRHVILISSFFVIALSKTIYTLLFPWNVTTPMSHSLNEIIRRCTLFFGYALPFPVDLSSILHSNPLYFVIIPVMLILVSGFLVGFFWPHKTNIISEKCLTAFSFQPVSG